MRKPSAAPTVLSRMPACSARSTLLPVTIIGSPARGPQLRRSAASKLVWLAVELVRQSSDGEGKDHVRHRTTLLEAISVIIVADAVDGLDRDVVDVASASKGPPRACSVRHQLPFPCVVWAAETLAPASSMVSSIILLSPGQKILGESI